METEIETEIQCEWCNKLRWREDLKQHGEEFFCKDSTCFEQYTEDKAARFDILHRDFSNMKKSLRETLKDLKSSNGQRPEFLIGYARGRIATILQEAEK